MAYTQECHKDKFIKPKMPHKSQAEPKSTKAYVPKLTRTSPCSQGHTRCTCVRRNAGPTIE